jgi:hypothetical protein
VKRVPNILVILTMLLLPGALGAGPVAMAGGNAQGIIAVVPSFSTCAMLTMGLLLMAMSILRHRKSAGSRSRKSIWER